MQARIDCQLCNLIKSPNEASANKGTKAALFFQAITVSQNFVSRCAGFSPCSLMLRHTTSPKLKMMGVVAQAAFKFALGFRLMARFVSCYVQTVHERNELSRLSDRSSRDIGLTTHDVEGILRRPILHGCWRSVNVCETERCRNICMADCRQTAPISLTRAAITQVDIDIK